MAASRRHGTGAYVQEWRFAALPDAHEAITEPVIEWCRETLASTRRPWGINHFDLAIAVGHGGNAEMRSLSFERLTPAELYDADAFIEALRGLIALPREAGDQAVHVAVALFSWGDAAHNALPASEAAS